MRRQGVGHSQSWFQQWFPVFFVILLITSNYYFQQAIFIPQMFTKDYMAGGLFMVIFLNINVALLVINYYKSIFTPPGSVAPDINDHYSDIESIKERASKEHKIKQILRKQKLNKNRVRARTAQQNHHDTFDMELSNQSDSLKAQIATFDMINTLPEVSFCMKCERIKPPRAHHCKDCNTCVLRMDHHCPWIANCVGVQNHKFFVLFLLHATLAIGACFVNITIDQLFNESDIRLSIANKNDRLFVLVNQFMTLGLVTAIGLLLVFQTIRMCKNQTTVESHIPDINHRNPFDKGFVQNICELLGQNPLLWLWPSNGRRPGISSEFQQYSVFDQENPRI